MIYKATVNGKTYEVEVERNEPTYQMISRSTYTGAEAPAAVPVAPAAAVPVAPAPTASAPVAAAPVAAPQAASALSSSETPVNSPMPGSILNINVAEGQSVEKGQTLVVLEAMKMENEIPAPASGVVKRIAVTKGSLVNTGELLVVLS